MHCRPWLHPDIQRGSTDRPIGAAYVRYPLGSLSGSMDILWAYNYGQYCYPTDLFVETWELGKAHAQFDFSQTEINTDARQGKQLGMQLNCSVVNAVGWLNWSAVATLWPLISRGLVRYQEHTARLSLWRVSAFNLMDILQIWIQFKSICRGVISAKRGNGR